MRVFVCEFVTGGGLRDKAIPPSLAREGAMMRDAAIADLANLPGVEILTTHDSRLSAPAETESEAVNGDPWALWRDAAADCDTAWPIAPETGGALARLTRLVCEAGCRSLGCELRAVETAASKRATWRALEHAGIPAVPVWQRKEAPADAAGPFVVKPDDGAGCEETWLVEDLTGVAGDCVVQPYVAGRPASLCVLARGGTVDVLTANEQHVTLAGGTFSFGGVTVGACPVTEELSALARAVIRAVPGLAGIFGIDLILTRDGPQVLEINPRLTTSYAGLCEAIGVNPAALVLERAAWSPRHTRPVHVAVEVGAAV